MKSGFKPVSRALSQELRADLEPGRESGDDKKLWGLTKQFFHCRISCTLVAMTGNFEWCMMTCELSSLIKTSDSVEISS